LLAVYIPVVGKPPSAPMLDDPRYDEPMRALTTEILHDPALAALYAERLDGPMKELKKERLRSAQRVGQLPEDLDLDMAIEMLWGPLQNRWLWRGGPLTPGYAEKVVETALGGLRRGARRSIPE
jgi:hypothetical protein